MAADSDSGVNTPGGINVTFCVFAAPLDSAMRSALRVSMNITDENALLPLSTFQAALANLS